MTTGVAQAVEPTAQPDASSLEQRRVPVDCTVSERTGGIAPATSDVTAVRCDGHSGFFVPSRLYRQLREDEGAQDEIVLTRDQIAELRLAVSALTRSSSSSKDAADLYREGWREERSAREAEEPGLLDHPGVWIAVGALVAIGAMVASKTVE
ncbi:MAG: hypothetical protein HY791_02830 [Deltaproteobacteria bacterium]|nr:hypothetical protein [Deltaproteobacteria bacterium]